ncbi:tRNA uridine-5-carboxymethylaminomethyl(34) synthesis enzyme MnmG [Helicobacter monodelphidis]|uniref:tRNA uridine-5-carboxymethylaminomethyl(34) synthesis enzyme MnmG n=1 Tax=Helicobacter sp. 15-1451 TaxID=2004995 RepID=UPI000DCC50EA|nr:tRNA uridine-5-carboxymethylaminomethyl(34) synthesis enzyme MnmG [Helicobacter sp. 15-1451]RAX57035.1 tRNA uridine-5-carboxymethylaminomethyl(34) synthesis enzyme MnmG [Helicobacter sp. 15-1451]
MSYDIIVVGGGHAGIEASIVSAKMGNKTLLLTILVEQIGAASCNPAIGGLAKGHLVKEIDALGGVMGKATDECGIQFRILNNSKGPAVRGSRAQIDMDAYRIYMKDLILQTPNLEVRQELVEKLLLDSDSIQGVQSELGRQYYAKKVILTTGTFLNGKVHIGNFITHYGRMGEPSAKKLGDNLKELGLDVGRLKTGTCPRIKASSIDFSVMEQHLGDTPPPPFSTHTTPFIPKKKQLPCFVTYTNDKTHQIITQNLHRAPMFSGQIQSIGPRYCPSIEDKINRFKDKERHQLFIEPQTQEATEYYINGLTTSLPYDIQEEIIHSIKGLENAEIVRYGYAIEYDYVNPTDLHKTFETKKIKNLYLAGQINGTTGYEEAAAQGLYAGINASLSIANKPPFILQRNESYLGVLVDDLTQKGTKEPYRMFTSRAEYRLLLREDNAQFRLGHYAYEFGLISQKHFLHIKQCTEQIKNALQYLKETFITPNIATLQRLEKLGEEKINDKCTLLSIVARKSFNKEKLCELEPKFKDFHTIVLEQIIIEARYANYITKAEQSIRSSEELKCIHIPKDFCFHGIPGLSLEVIEKLSNLCPNNLLEVSQISGITPASIDVLSLYIHLHKKLPKETE